MLVINARISIPLEEIELNAIRAQGNGGQHVNKTSTAIHLRFDIRASSLAEDLKARVLLKADQRITRDGVVVIKAQQHRSQEANREAALARLADLLVRALHVPATRRATRPSRAAKQRRVDDKTRRGGIKALRRSLDD
ncbi:MAG: alternative ribosome rescue aminoacyl-tRNA hydrolase ArfB [Nevskia sp.]|uniref:alternative ribosome rescue aminoacyl-tRNA hydrolase ArfB n=1 Tax=Nevskia sp. TaxID=1929292 RepID=UPI0040369718